jgi:general L-amino acid transport system permease protein
MADVLLSTSPVPSVSRIRKKLFPTPISGLISIVGLAAIAWLTWIALKWALFEAVFVGTPADCANAAGACWAVVSTRWRLMFFGLYPYEEHWRTAFACLTLIAVIILSCLPVFWNFVKLGILWLTGLTIFILVMRGGFLGLPIVTEEKWGGLTLSIFIFAGAALIGMPLAIGLALLRRSPYPLLSRGAGIFIDGVRSVPLVTILFSVVIVLPIVAPDIAGTKLTRVIIGMGIFFAAYQAEIIRSGIQALPLGQEEAAKALGLSYWQRMRKIVLPQAFRRALPPTVSQFAISFKEVALVIVVGMFDFLTSGNAAYGSGEWAFTYVEVYFFMAFIYFIFVFSLSRYGAYLERRMRVGR